MAAQPPNINLLQPQPLQPQVPCVAFTDSCSPEIETAPGKALSAELFSPMLEKAEWVVRWAEPERVIPEFRTLLTDTWFKGGSYNSNTGVWTFNFVFDRVSHKILEGRMQNSPENKLRIEFTDVSAQSVPGFWSEVWNVKVTSGRTRDVQRAKLRKDIAKGASLSAEALARVKPDERFLFMKKIILFYEDSDALNYCVEVVRQREDEGPEDYDHNMRNLRVACDPMGWNLLHFAAAYRRPQTLTHLCNSEAMGEYALDVNLGDFRGFTPLHFAVMLKHVDAVTALIACSADVSAANSVGKAPVSYCTDAEILPSVQPTSVLHPATRASMSVRDAYKTSGAPPRSRPSWARRTYMVNRLPAATPEGEDERHAPVRKMKKSKSKKRSRSSGQAKSIEECEPKDLKKSDALDFTPLHYAACNNTLKIAEYMIKSGLVSGTERDMGENTPLHFALMYQNVEVAVFLLQNCPEALNIPNARGLTPEAYDSAGIVAAARAGTLQAPPAPTQPQTLPPSQPAAPAQPSSSAHVAATNQPSNEPVTALSPTAAALGLPDGPTHALSSTNSGGSHASPLLSPSSATAAAVSAHSAGFVSTPGGVTPQQQQQQQQQQQHTSLGGGLLGVDVSMSGGGSGSESLSARGITPSTPLVQTTVKSEADPTWIPTVLSPASYLNNANASDFLSPSSFGGPTVDLSMVGADPSYDFTSGSMEVQRELQNDPTTPPWIIHQLNSLFPVTPIADGPVSLTLSNSMSFLSNDGGDGGSFPAVIIDEGSNGAVGGSGGGADMSFQ